MIKGLIIRQISNQYQVYYDGQVLDCVAMGKLRLDKSPKVGDYVLVNQFENQNGIEQILERKNEMIRPSIANVDQVIILMSSVEPQFSNKLLDRLISMVEYHHINPVIVITKMDLINDELNFEIAKYRNLGYTVILSGIGFDHSDFDTLFKDKVSVLTGNSGVGKSSLINRLNPDFNLRTQITSKALGRGKHTTRHTQLYAINGGWVADTPGFSSLSFVGFDKHILKNTFIEFKQYQCKYMDCIHQNEPDCGVKQALSKHEIEQSRYENYLEILQLTNKENKK